MEDQSLYCVFDYFSESGGYSTNGERCVFYLHGRVWNTDATAFEGKRVQVEISILDAQWQEKVAAFFGRRDGCGGVTILPRAEPEVFEFQGEQSEIPPIQVHLAIPSEVWQRLRNVAYCSIRDGLFLGGDLKFWTPNRQGWGLERLDLSKKTEYLILGFNLNRFRQRIEQKYVKTSPPRNPMGESRKLHSLSFALSGIDFGRDFPSAELRRLRAYGNVRPDSPLATRIAKNDPYCSPSAPVRHNEGLHEGRNSGSS